MSIDEISLRNKQLTEEVRLLKERLANVEVIQRMMLMRLGYPGSMLTWEPIYTACQYYSDTVIGGHSVVPNPNEARRIMQGGEPGDISAGIHKIIRGES